MGDININHYSEHADAFFNQYSSVDFEQVHKDWFEQLPNQGVALDAGCGSGRDALYLANKGLTVVAVEPATSLLEKAKQHNNHANISWLSDQLPELNSVLNLQLKFDLILLSAVWMHIPQSHRERAFRKLSNLLKPNGKLIISLRFGDSPDKRLMYPVSADELSKLATQQGLTFKHIVSNNSLNDAFGRESVRWETVILTLPDDGTGSFPLIRNIVVNDNKSSTYKIALLRTLIRIAEGHPGAVLSQTEEGVELPLGLIALYWLKLYKPLIDTYNIQQSSNSKAGLGFVKANGWMLLTELHQSDFSIGRTFNRDIARAVYQTLKDICSTIKGMPAKHITLPNSDQQVFSVEITRTMPPKSGLSIDTEFLKSLGSFIVPKSVWDVLARYSVWIEPTVINEWCSLMSVYNKTQRSLTKTDFLNALNIDEPARTTARVRERVKELMQNMPVMCVWSEKPLSHSDKFAIDHAFPFSRWPNNDLWNLLPTTFQINAKKSDKLPSAVRLANARDVMTDWWQKAWGKNQSEFFTQASLALPQLGLTNQSYDDVFEAMRVQRDRLRDFQQLTEWL